MLKRTPLVALFTLWMYAGAFRVSFSPPDAGRALSAVMGLLFATLFSAAAYQWAYGRWPLSGLFSRPLWFGQPLANKYVYLVVVAVMLQLVVPLDPVTARDIWMAPLSAAIWLGVGYAAWLLVRAGRSRFGREAAADAER